MHVFKQFHVFNFKIRFVVIDYDVTSLLGHTQNQKTWHEPSDYIVLSISQCKFIQISERFSGILFLSFVRCAHIAEINKKEKQEDKRTVKSPDEVFEKFARCAICWFAENKEKSFSLSTV